MQSLIEEYCSDLEIIGYAPTVREGIEKISDLKPNLVFLDIELDDGKGFEILKALSDQEFKVIFTTAYDQYALKAFEYAAVDYVLKPYGPNEIRKAVDRVRSINYQQQAYEKLINMLPGQTPSSKTKIMFTTLDSVELVEAESIVMCIADSGMTQIYMDDGERIFASKLLGGIEDQLAGRDFYRSHKSAVINLKKVKRLDIAQGDVIVMEGGLTAPLARRRKIEFLDLLSAI